MWDAIPPPLPRALYKEPGWGLGHLAQPIKARKAKGTGTNLLPRPATARFPASAVRHPKRVRTTWQACGTKAMGEATSPHPVIVGSGRLEDHAPAPFSKWAEPPCLPPFMGKARTAPFYYNVTHVRRAQPHACRPRHTRLPTPSHAWEA